MERIMNSPPTLCLNMIVKNESKIITRLLDSVISIIDCYCICDTGSTDDTIEVIETYFNNYNTTNSTKKVEGKIVKEPFQNFCHNRNVALQSCLGMSDFVLLLDADMILSIRTFDKSMLCDADCFGIVQGSESFHYQNIRIVRNNDQFRYVGVTHEYISYPNEMKSKMFEKSIIFINDIGDGGCKRDKFERDIRLLTEGIQKEPNAVRYYFYLANSYHDLGRYDEAINYYKKRIEFGSWKEEVWYSYYRIGMCYMKQNNVKDALWSWMEGYNYYPERVEGLYEMMKWYRLKGQNKAAYAVYKMCKEFIDVNVNREHYLFLSDIVYKSALLYEYTIVAAYNGISNINDAVVRIMNYHPNSNEVDNLLSNMKFYKDVLKVQSKQIFDHSFDHYVSEEMGKVTFYSSSSCMIPNPYTKKGYLMNVRYVNYTINERGDYLKCDKHIITMNRYLVLDDQFQIVDSGIFDITFDGRLYIGVEDVRIYYDNHSSKIKCIGTGYHQSNKIGIVSGEYDYESRQLQNIQELTQSFQESHCEKNWVFVNYNNNDNDNNNDNKTNIVYKWNPLQICNQSSNTISVHETKTMPSLFSRVRGSTCGFTFHEEIWFVGHIVSYEQPRHYYHIISVFDNNMNLLRYSAPFKFEGDPIEYCLSIIVEEDRVLINYSTWDRTTRIGIYEKTYIESILCYQ